jgi:O-antigen chain-terminating methyltransferase
MNGRIETLSAALSDTRHELSAERERALRGEAGLRTEMTLHRATLLRATGGFTRNESVADPAAPVVVESAFADVHLAIADRFRGDSSIIEAQLRNYLTVVEAGPLIDDDHPLIDIGTGRGEWLTTCRQTGIPAFGVEIDPYLAERARTDGLDVRTGDGVATLQTRDENSVGAVTAFHVIEHLEFEQLLTLFDESLRTLVPGGVLICETPNPANVTVGACNFYLDPTHRRPLPAQLVAFLLDARGFTDIEILELQPNDAMRLEDDSEAARRINGFFYGPQNYAAIARKPGAIN